jgi:DNA-directed RNA polymerase subunit beta'
MMAPQGGWNVSIENINHYVPGNLSLTAKMGDTVSKGDAITTGTVKPQELAGLRDPLTAKMHMVNELDKAYKSEGRSVRKNLFETVVSSLLNKGQITDPGKSEFMHGDVVNLNKINNLNKAGNEIKSVPLFHGLNQAPLQDDDFLTRLNFQRLKETLTEGVSRLWKSDIKGTSPIPALVTGEKLK